MRLAVRASLVAVALLGAGAAPAGAASQDQPRTEAAPLAAQSTAVRGTGGLSVAAEAASGTEEVLKADTAAAVAAANVCGSGYTISVSAARYGTYGTAYTWWNGTYSGSNTLYDRPICAVFANDTGITHHMGVRLKDNYVATADTEISVGNGVDWVASNTYRLTDVPAQGSDSQTSTVGGVHRGPIPQHPKIHVDRMEQY
ncbi:hypothetical protein ACWER6_28305 [Streptomyces sp. NPDC004009]